MNRPGVNDDGSQVMKWLFNSWPQSGGSAASTSTFEPFVDEKYRYDPTFSFTSATRVLPVGPGVKYDSTAILVAGAQEHLQVLGDRVVYPRTNFLLVTPAGPNYAAVFAADPVGAFRVYYRVFDTGLPRTTGRFRIKGLSLATFQATVAFSGDPATDHPGSAMIVIAVPGAQVGLDLGRPLGSPDLNMTLALRGCLTGVEDDGIDTLILSYDLGLPTANNGFGEYPLAMSVTIFKTGFGLVVDEIEWLPPV